MILILLLTFFEHTNLPIVTSLTLYSPLRRSYYFIFKVYVTIVTNLNLIRGELTIIKLYRVNLVWKRINALLTVLFLYYFI